MSTLSAQPHNLSKGKELEDEVECPICCEDEVSMLTCPGCQQAFCLDCLQTYFLTKYDNPHCPEKSCAIGYKPEFLTAHFPKRFMTKTWPQHQKHGLLEREKALLPLAQDIAAVRRRQAVHREKIGKSKLMMEQVQEKRLLIWKKKDKLTSLRQGQDCQTAEEQETKLQALDQEIMVENLPADQAQYETQIKTMLQQLSQLVIKHSDLLTIPVRGAKKPLKVLRKELYQQIESLTSLQKLTASDADELLTNQLRELNHQIHNYEHQINQEWEKIHELEKKPVEKKKSLKKIKCPANDCQGFVVQQPKLEGPGESWQCLICFQDVCVECYTVIKDLSPSLSPDESHQCDPQELESIRLIQEDTVPCPECQMPIHKIHGCNQMFCTECGTPFNYRTGQKLRGNWHNPHQIDGARQATHEQNTAVVADPGPCRLVYRRCLTDNDQNEYHKFIINGIGHIRTMILRRYACNIDDSLMKQRVKYLLGEINDKSWTTQIWKFERKANRFREIRALLQTMIDIGSDICNNLVPNNLGSKTAREKVQQDNTQILQQAREVLTQVQQSFLEINRRYKCQTPYFDINWQENLLMPNGMILNHDATTKKLYPHGIRYHARR